MVAFNYGTPSTNTIDRPRCHARSYDEGTRECRGCGFQVSCKDEIIRANVNRQPIVPAYFQPNQPYAQPQPVPYNYAPPAPVPQYPHPQQAQFNQALAQGLQQRVAPQPQKPIHQPPAEPYGYGWIQDPLYYQLQAVPPPVRPQMMGETFVERVVKNTGLAMLESLFGQCFLAIRQLVLPPMPPPPPQQQVIQHPPQQQ